MSAASAFGASSSVRRSCASLARASSSVSRFCSAVIGGTTSFFCISSSALFSAFSAVFSLRLVVRAGGQLLAALAVDLLDEIAVLGLAVVGRLDLRLAIELDEEIAALDRACPA